MLNEAAPIEGETSEAQAEPRVEASEDARRWALREARLALIGKHDWPVLTRALVVRAHRRLGAGAPLAAAEDQAQEAIVAFLRAAEDWDPKVKIIDHLGSILNGILIDHLRLSATRLEKPADHDDFGADSSRSPAVSVDLERTLGVRDYGRRLFAECRTRLAGDKLALAVVSAYIDGVTKPQEQADRIVAPMHKIVAARARFDRMVVQIIKELERNCEHERRREEGPARPRAAAPAHRGRRRRA